jgi:hypothetical protein
MQRFLLLLFTCLIFATPTPVSAHALVVRNDTLIGIEGVRVGSKLYDVQFVDGTCTQVFDNCSWDALSFFDAWDAVEASEALLNAISGTPFDGDPTLIQGCNFVAVCWFFTTYGVQWTDPSGLNHTDFYSFTAVNFSYAAGPRDRLGGYYLLWPDSATSCTTTEPTCDDGLVWAKWSQRANTVPSPTSLALALIAMFVLAVRTREIRMWLAARYSADGVQVARTIRRASTGRIARCTAPRCAAHDRGHAS